MAHASVKLWVWTAAAETSQVLRLRRSMRLRKIPEANKPVQIRNVLNWHCTGGVEQLIITKLSVIVKRFILLLFWKIKLLSKTCYWREEKIELWPEKFLFKTIRQKQSLLYWSADLKWCITPWCHWLIFWCDACRLTPETTSKKKKKRKGLGSVQPLYRVFTSFRPWSVCDRCGVPGEQVRVGLCHVHSHFLHVRYRRANQTVASCGSGAVPRAFGLLRRSRVGAKLEVKSCQVTCPTQTPPSFKILGLMTFLGYK